MRTSKPISTISYNSDAFLTQKLEEMVKAHTISDWMFIHHIAEADEAKDHTHLWIKPNKLVDSMAIQDYLREYDPTHPDKPLKCTDFRYSDTDDWILYGMHLEPYLKSKGLERQYHYTPYDFRYHDEDTFNENLNHALKGSSWAERMQLVAQLQLSEFDPVDLVKSGRVPIQMSSAIRAFSQLMYDSQYKHIDSYNMERLRSKESQTEQEKIEIE